MTRAGYDVKGTHNQVINQKRKHGPVKIIGTSQVE
jgi:hypothetical protein